MARTRGAKDKKKRKPSSVSVRKPAAGPLEPGPPAPADRPIPTEEFTAAIAAELAADDSSRCHGPSPDPTAATVAADAARTFDPSALTIEGLTSAWQVPFWLLGRGLQWLGVIPEAEPVLAVGRRRAKDLAKPSYAIYEHYARQYLSFNPNNTVHVAGGVTALNGVAIVPEIVEAVIKARRQAARASQPNQAAGPVVPAGPRGGQL